MWWGQSLSERSGRLYQQNETAERVIKDFERDFGLTDRNLFKVAYSPLKPSNVLMVGDSPGGDPEDPMTVANYKEEYEDGEHDFVDEDYLLAVKMRNLFADAFGKRGVMLLRGMPVTNVSFFRSPGQPSGRTTKGNREKCRPYLWRILGIVDPDLVLANGMDVFRYLQSHLRDVREIDRASPPPATGQQIYYRKVEGQLGVLGEKEVELVGFHHLSGYRWSNEKLSDLADRIKRDWPRR